MKYPLLLIASLFISTLSLKAQPPIEGIEVEDAASVNIYWQNYKQDAKNRYRKSTHTAIKKSVDNLSLFEYAIVLDRLYEVAVEIPDFKQQWNIYMDSLVAFAEQDYVKSSLIPFQAAFFHSTLQQSTLLASKNTELYDFLQNNTPKLSEMIIEPSEYKEILEKNAFSEVVGQSIILDLLLLDPVGILTSIDSNPQIKSRYYTWLDGSIDPSRNLRYDDNDPLEVQSRKLIYLVERLKKMEMDLAAESAEMIDMIQISSVPEEPELPEYYHSLSGTWEGVYDEKGREIRIYLVPISNKLDESQIKGHNKFVYQSNIKQIDMRGTFEDMGDYYQVKVEEYKVPFEEEPQWKQDAINEDWGGPDKFYPNDLSYGLFDLKIYKENKEMTGTWSSKSGKIVRKFTISKVGE